jgi:hypothetical protein
MRFTRIAGGRYFNRTPNAFLTRRTRRDLNSVAEETSSSEGTKKPSQALSFAFFAPSRETNLLSKFAPFGECTRMHQPARKFMTHPEPRPRQGRFRSLG